MKKSAFSIGIEKLNIIFLYIIHSFYYMLGSVMIYIFVSDNIFEITINYNYAALFSLFFYFMILAVSDIFEEKMNIDLLKSKVFILAIIIAYIISAIFCAYKQGLFAMIFTIGYFIIISIVALKINRTMSSIYIKVAKSIALMLVISSIYIADDRALLFDNSFINIIAIYFAVTIFYVVCFNFNEHYNLKNTINKNKNLFIFNLISASFITSITFFRSNLADLFISLKEGLSPSIYSFLDYIANALNSFMDKFFKIDFIKFIQDRLKKPEKSIEEGTKMPEEKTAEILEKVQNNLDLSLIYNIIIIILMIALIFILYKSLRSYSHKKPKKKSFEEREFVFNKDDFINDLKNKLKYKFRRHEKLPAERILYRDTVNSLIKDGYEISKSTTPNEYINIIYKEDIRKYNFEKITSDYNDCRYGRDD